MSKVDTKPTRQEPMAYKIRAKVEKRERKGGPIVETVESDGNLTTTSGLARRAAVLIGGSVALSAAAVRLGVGDSAAAAAPSDTALSAGANQYYQVMEATFPSTAAGVATFKAVYDASEANFTWASWGLDVDDGEAAAPTGTPDDLFNRKVFAFGTKDGGEWTLTVTLTLS